MIFNENVEKTEIKSKRVVDIDISYDFVGILPKSLFEEMKNEPME